MERGNIGNKAFVYIFNNGIFAYIREVLEQIKGNYVGLDIIKINHDVDHIGRTILPRISVSQAVRMIKSNTSKSIKKKFNFLNTCTGARMKYGLMDILYLL